MVYGSRPQPRTLALVLPGSSCVLLAAPGCSWLVLVGPDCSWLLLAGSGWSWLLLAGPVWCCVLLPVFLYTFPCLRVLLRTSPPGCSCVVRGSLGSRPGVDGYSGAVPILMTLCTFGGGLDVVGIGGYVLDSGHACVVCVVCVGASGLVNPLCCLSVLVMRSHGCLHHVTHAVLAARVPRMCSVITT